MKWQHGQLVCQPALRDRGNHQFYNGVFFFRDIQGKWLYNPHYQNPFHASEPNDVKMAMKWRW